MTVKHCAVCSASFACGSHSGLSCWCADLPTIMPITKDQDCYCPRCLTEIVQEKISDFLQNNPVKMAVPSQYQTKNLVQDIDYYIENGNFVFTQWYHRKRGSCCGNGCRHCPYQHVNVR